MNDVQWRCDYVIRTDNRGSVIPTPLPYRLPRGGTPKSVLAYWRYALCGELRIRCR